MKVLFQLRTLLGTLCIKDLDHSLASVASSSLSCGKLLVWGLRARLPHGTAQLWIVHFELEVEQGTREHNPPSNSVFPDHWRNPALLCLHSPSPGSRLIPGGGAHGWQRLRAPLGSWEPYLSHKMKCRSSIPWGQSSRLSQNKPWPCEVKKALQRRVVLALTVWLLPGSKAKPNLSKSLI